MQGRTEVSGVVWTRSLKLRSEDVSNDDVENEKVRGGGRAVLLGRFRDRVRKCILWKTLHQTLSVVQAFVRSFYVAHSFL